MGKKIKTEQKIFSTKKEVIKASGAIQMTNKISLLQRRTWNILLASAFNDLLDSEEHHIEVKQLMNTLEYSSKNEDHLKDSLRELTTTAVEWNILQKDKTAIWGVTTLLSQVEIKDGVCTWAYSPALKKKLFQPRMYAKINLFIQNKFDSKHSLALYEICVDYYDRSRRKGETPYISIEDFRKLMGIESHEYAEFKYLNKRTISEPIDEINKKSDILVIVDYKRSGRKVSHVKFIIEPQPYHKAESRAIEEGNAQHTDSIESILIAHKVSQESMAYYTSYIPRDVLLNFLYEFQEKLDQNLIRYPRPYLSTVLEKLVTQYHNPILKSSGSANPLGGIDLKQLPEHLMFLKTEEFLNPKTGELILTQENRKLSLRLLKEYTEEFWHRVYDKYQHLKEDKPKIERLEMAFIESEREEDFMNHPVFSLLLEKCEQKTDFSYKKIEYLQKITDLYWQVIEKALDLDKALEKIDNEE